MKPINLPNVVYIDTLDYYTPWSEKRQDEYDVCYIKADTLIDRINLELKALQDVEPLAEFDNEKAWNIGYTKAKKETLELIQGIIEKENARNDT